MKLHPDTPGASPKNKDILLHSHSIITLNKSNIDKITLPNI